MPIEPNFRYIQIDTDTEIGYSYPQAQFYVLNKNTTTYRDTEEAIEDVLKALEIIVGVTTDIDGKIITTERIEALRDNIETLETDPLNPSLYKGITYTWDETGSFIHSVQFNKWNKYPIVIDCNKVKLYILNSTTIFDLQTNESPEIVRIPILCSFYQQKLGIEIPTKIMTAIYNLLVSYYDPDNIISLYKPYYLTHKCTNQITLNKDIENSKPTYNNTFIVSNFNGTTPLVYSCTNDPYNETLPTNIGDIIEADNDTNTITLAEPLKDITPFTVKEGTKLIVKGTETIVDNSTYTIDGTYTVQSISADNKTIIVSEPLSTSYSFPFYTCYVEDSKYTVTSMNRDSNTIVVTEAPNQILIGDTITITGAIIPSTFTTISLDGRYTVQTIQGNTITVNEAIETNFTGNATLTKEILLGNIKEVQDSGLTLILVNNIPEEYLNNLVSKDIIVYNSSISSRETSKINTVDPETSTLTVTNPITVEAGYPQYPQLQYPSPNTTMLIDITSSNYASVLPTGKFMVDNFNQVISYLSIVDTVSLPTTETDEYGNRSIKDSMYNELATSMFIPVEVKGQLDPDIVEIVLKGNGIYQKEYEENT